MFGSHQHGTPSTVTELGRGGNEALEREPGVNVLDRYFLFLFIYFISVFQKQEQEIKIPGSNIVFRVCVISFLSALLWNNRS